MDAETDYNHCLREIPIINEEYAVQVTRPDAWEIDMLERIASKWDLVLDSEYIQTWLRASQTALNWASDRNNNGGTSTTSKFVLDPVD